MLSKRFDFLGYKIPVLVPVVLAFAIVVWVVVSTRPTDRGALTQTTIEVGDSPQMLGSGPFGLWVALGGEQAVQEIYPATGETAEAIPIGVLPGALAVTDESVWVGSIEGRAIKRFMPGGRPTSVRVGRTPQALAIGDGELWVASFDDGTIWRIDLGTAAVGEPIQLEEAFPSALAYGFGSMWVTDVVADTVLRLDAHSGELEETIPVGDSPTGIAIDEHGVWVANFNDSTVTHIDPENNEEVGTAVVVGGNPGGIAAGEGYVWVTRPDDDSVVRIDPSESEWTGEVFEVGKGPHGVVVAAGSIWVANQESDTVTRLTPEE